jgi:hypothetical protein
MSKIVANLRYSKEHQWAKVEGNVVYVGITDYAQDSLAKEPTNLSASFSAATGLSFG